MPPEQFALVIDTIPKLKIRKWKDEDIQMMFKIDYWLALRFDEGLKLKAEDFDLDVNEVYLGTTKTEKGDSANIPEPFKHELNVYLVGRKGPLFPGLTYGTAITWINRLGKMLDIPAWTTPQSESGEKTKTHIFRKSIGKDMIYGEFGKKAPITFVSQTLRHKGKNPLAMTFKYLKIGNQDVKDWWQEEKPEEEQIKFD
jgi:integrase